MSHEPIYLTPEELVTRWRGAVTVETLSNKRSKREGPAYVKIGRGVLYPLDKVIAFEQAQARGPASADKDA